MYENLRATCMEILFKGIKNYEKRNCSMLNFDDIQSVLNTSEDDIQMDKELIETMIWILEEIGSIQDGTERNK